MSKLIKKQLPILDALYRCSPHQRRNLLKSAEPGTVRAICECAKNVLKANVPLTPKTKKSLKRYKKHLRNLASRRGKSQSKKKQLLKLKGGFLPLLLGPVLSLIGGVAGKAIGKALKL